MTEAEAAWVAGIYEGEGSVYKVGEQTTWALLVKMTDVDVIERLRTVTGVGRVYHYTTKADHHKDGAKWQVARKADREAVVQAVWPWLSPRRQEQIQHMLDREDRLRN